MMNLHGSAKCIRRLLEAKAIYGSNGMGSCWCAYTFFNEYYFHLSVPNINQGFESEEADRPTFKGIDTTSIVDGTPWTYFPEDEKLKRSRVISVCSISCAPLIFV